MLVIFRERLPYQLEAKRCVVKRLTKNIFNIKKLLLYLFIFQKNFKQKKLLEAIMKYTISAVNNRYIHAF